jgi:hypothetical protein
MRPCLRLIAGIAVMLTFLGVSGAGLGSGNPRVGLVDERPVVVRGAGFKARERVAVQVVAFGGPLLRRRVTAGRRGAFTVRFAGRTLQACRGYTVRAAGNRGSRAFVREVPAPCGIDPQP